MSEPNSFPPRYRGRSRIPLGLSIGLAGLLAWQLQPEALLLSDIEGLPATSPLVVDQLEREVDEILARSSASAPVSDSISATPAGSNAGTEDGGPSGPDEDPEWQTLPRNDVPIPSLVRHVERDGLLKVAPLLFRNSFLNEGDIYISPQRRGRIWARLAPTAEQLQALGDATTAYLNRELPLMAATGSLPRMSMDVTPEKIDLVKRGARMRMKAAREQQDAGQDMSAQIAEIQDELDNPERHAHSVIPGRSGVVGVQLGAHVYQAPMRALPGGDLLVDTANYLRATFGMMCLTRFELEGTVSVERLRQERERIDHVFQQVVSESTRPK